MEALPAAVAVAVMALLMPTPTTALLVAGVVIDTVGGALVERLTEVELALSEEPKKDVVALVKLTPTARAVTWKLLVLVGVVQLKTWVNWLSVAALVLLVAIPMNAPPA